MDNKTLTELAERFSAAGHQLYLVGGAVRDAMLGRGIHDIDLTTDAVPDVIAETLEGWADTIWDQGRKFGTIGAFKGGETIEITTHRAEAYLPESRKPEVSFSSRIEDDLARRDFTINAMAVRLSDQTLIDPHNGVKDLKDRVLRTPLAPSVSFSEDPLRMLRAARFVARLGMNADGLLTTVTGMADRLDIISRERIRDELDKLMVLDDPSAGLLFLIRTGLANRFLPELPALFLETDEVHRHKDVLAHTIAVVAKTSPDRILRLAALFHDVGKPKTRSIERGKVTFYNHDVVGAGITRRRMRELRYSTQDIYDVSRLVELHLRVHSFAAGWTDSAVRRYVRDAGELLDKLNELIRCDCTTRNENKAKTLSRLMDELDRRIAELRQREELDAIRPDLSGHEVMQILGIEPGPLVGKALNWLMDLRLEEGPLGQEEAERRLREWWERGE